ncbi:MAG TPA: phage terminase large subunit family protein [Kiritimatiellia bacterium]|nr:phage terminase large subunit family protein [Kiritimatiellia bacterium]
MKRKRKTIADPKEHANTLRRARRAAASLVERRPVADPKRRKRLERDPAAWLRWYLSAAFPLPFGAVHKDMIGAAVRAIRTGAGMAVAAPRGTGKTSVLWGVAMWALLSGQCRFPVIAGWSHQAARRMLRKWVEAVAGNERLLADYPDGCAPFQLSTHANRLKGCGWSDTGELCGADVQMMTGTLVLPDSIGALGAVSISGSARGLSVGLPDGSAIRPDVLLLDDPQDKATAESPALVRKVIEKIEADLFNLSGPDRRLAVMAAVTIIAEADVATHFLEHPDFEAVRVRQVTTWPEGWESKESQTRALWEEWDKARTEGLTNRDGGKAARAFYRAHKATMTKGMVVSWPARYDKKRKDPDAMFAAMWDFFRLGERAFMAERQNEPLQSAEASLFELPQSHVAGRVNGHPRRAAPDNAAFLVGMIDINADGLRWALAAASNTRALAIVDYGLYPGGGVPLIREGETEALGIMRGLNGLDQTLRGLPIMRGPDRMAIDVMLVDCGGTWMQAVFDWLSGPARLSPVRWLASRGQNSRFYRPGRNIVGRPGDGWHLAQWAGKGRVLVHNSDQWRHRQQKGWLLPTAAPDSIAFFGTDGTRHDHFADGVVCERLVAFAESPAGPLYRWQNTPGLRNDWGDVATGLFVASSFLGLSPAGRVRPVAAKRRAPKISFVKTR